MKKKEKIFIVTKYISAENVEDAIKKDKKTPVEDIRPYTNSPRQEIGFVSDME